jgi:hypothetical protein
MYYESVPLVVHALLNTANKVTNVAIPKRLNRLSSVLSPSVLVSFYFEQRRIMPDNLVIDHSFRTAIFTPEAVLSDTYVNCIFSMAALEGVIISGKFLNCAFLATTLRHCKIRDAKFDQCDFAMAEITDSDVRDTMFKACDFSGATLKGLRGTTTCSFMRTCVGLDEAQTDLKIEIKPHSSLYTVTPQTAIYLLGNETDDMPMKAQGDRKVPRRVTGNTWPPKTTPYNRSAHKRAASPGHNALVDPKKLPEVDHYRSPPRKIPKSKKPYEATETYMYDEDDYCGYMMGGYGAGGRHHGTYTVTRNAEYEYGYMKNCVLTCSDIEEYKGCTE